VTGGQPGAAARVTWLGHSTVLIDQGGVRVLTDPVLRRGIGHLRRPAAVAPEAVRDIDVVLISHVHYDHLDVRSLARLGRATAIVVPDGGAGLLRRRGFRQVVEAAAGETVAVAGMRAVATHAEHAARRLPGGRRVPALGYVIEGPRRIYFAGDTDIFPGMAGLGPDLDVALLPIAGWGPRLPPGHLDAERAAQALRLLRPRMAVPIHWGTYHPLHLPPPATDPAAEFVRVAAAHAPDVQVRVLAVGASLDL
jgi:L-ascorbate metabolism protein UlaG (beta-lactamase superfamily)